MKNIPNNILCVIPARGGSKGIIDKNLRLIYGIPLVEHSIIHALESGINPKNIYVSSDSRKILHIAERNNVVAQERPCDISGSKSSTEETLIYVLDASCSNNYEHVLLLQPTSPIRFKNTLNKFISFYLENNFDSALTTTKFHDFFWKEDSDGISFVSTYDPAKRPMRQDLYPYDFVHLDNGNAYLTDAKILRSTKCRVGKNVGVFPISEIEGMQIDTHKDLEIFRDIFEGTIPQKMGLQRNYLKANAFSFLNHQHR